MFIGPQLNLWIRVAGNNTLLSKRKKIKSRCSHLFQKKDVDVDMNASRPYSTKPVENIFFARTKPDRYRVFVHNYNCRSDTQNNSAKETKKSNKKDPLTLVAHPHITHPLTLTLLTHPQTTPYSVHTHHTHIQHSHTYHTLTHISHTYHTLTHHSVTHHPLTNYTVTHHAPTTHPRGLEVLLEHLPPQSLSSLYLPLYSVECSINI